MRGARPVVAIRAYVGKTQRLSGDDAVDVDDARIRGLDAVEELGVLVAVELTRQMRERRAVRDVDLAKGSGGALGLPPVGTLDRGRDGLRCGRRRRDYILSITSIAPSQIMEIEMPKITSKPMYAIQ